MWLRSQSRINATLAKPQTSSSINLATSSVAWPLSPQGVLGNDPYLSMCSQEAFSISCLKESMGALKFCCGKTIAGLELTGRASLLFRYMSFSQYSYTCSRKQRDPLRGRNLLLLLIMLNEVRAPYVYVYVHPAQRSSIVL
ncbi:hypothetical protein INR49_021726 [Caranx melampygus]|nr:hypothetical protein INR49_021726 [Caranx melampygus]